MKKIILLVCMVLMVVSCASGGKAQRKAASFEASDIFLAAWTGVGLSFTLGASEGVVSAGMASGTAAWFLGRIGFDVDVVRADAVNYLAYGQESDALKGIFAEIRAKAGDKVSKFEDVDFAIAIAKMKVQK